MTRSRRRTRAEWDEHLSGVRALHDGVCLRCPEPILRDQRVIRHRDGWIHVQCASGSGWAGAVFECGVAFCCFPRSEKHATLTSTTQAAALRMAKVAR
jgi:hypothetical protein